MATFALGADKTSRCFMIVDDATGFVLPQSSLRGPASSYKTADGLVTRVPELLGQTLLEGMACATCAICTDVASMPEVVEDGVSGFVVPATIAGVCARNWNSCATAPTRQRSWAGRTAARAENLYLARGRKTFLAIYALPKLKTLLPQSELALSLTGSKASVALTGTSLHASTRRRLAAS